MFVIPKETPEGLILSGARVAGEFATIAAAKARILANNSSNPYIGNTNTIFADLADSELYKSEIGTPVYADVTFDTVTYIDANNKKQTTPKITFQAILISLSFPRVIIKTEIQGRNGTVKEYIGEGDAQISFSGVIVGLNGQYPTDAVNQLLQVIQAPIEIPVICKYLNDKGVQTIVFEDRTFNQEEGGYSYQQFSLSAISDTPQELKMS